MRNIALYQDKVFVATTDAHLVALDARTGKQVWSTAIADSAKGYASYAGPIVIKGKVVQGLPRCDRFGNDGCWISAFDADTGKLAWKFNTIARIGTARRRRRGASCADQLPRRRRDMDRRQPTTRISTSPTGASRRPKPWMRASRDDDRVRQRALHTRRPSRCEPTTARSRGTTSTRRASRWTSTKCSRRCWSTSAIRSCSSRSASRASCGSSIAGTASSSITRKRCFRTSSSRIDQEDRHADLSRRHHRAGDRHSGSSRARARRADTTGRR